MSTENNQDNADGQNNGNGDGTQGGDNANNADGQNNGSGDGTQGGDNGSQVEFADRDELLKKLGELESKNKALTKRNKELSGSFDEERSSFETERSTFANDRKSYESQRASDDKLIEGVVQRELATWPEATQKAVKAQFKDARSQLKQLQFLEASGLKPEDLPGRTTPRTAGGGNENGQKVPTFRDLKDKERSGAYET